MFVPGRVRSLLTLVWAAIVGISVIPVVGFVVGTGLDPSWGLGLHMAHAQNLAFGRDIVWTFGPLGFLVSPTMAYPTTGLSAFWFRLPVFAGVAWLVLIRLRSVSNFGPVGPARSSVARRIGSLISCALLAFPITWLLIGSLGGGGNIIVAIYVISAAFAVRALLTDSAVPFAALVIASVASALALLVRFDTGLVGVLLTLLVALDRKVGLRRVAFLTAVFGFSVLFAWVLLGQPLSTFIPYVHGSMELGRGYGGGMAWSAHSSWTTPVALGVVLVTGFSIGLSRSLRRPTLYGVLGDTRSRRHNVSAVFWALRQRPRIAIGGPSRVVGFVVCAATKSDCKRTVHGLSPDRWNVVERRGSAVSEVWLATR